MPWLDITMAPMLFIAAALLAVAAAAFKGEWMWQMKKPPVDQLWRHE